MTGALTGQKILIVDDHRNIRITLKLTLESEGATVEEAESYKAGLAKLSSIGGLNKETFAYHMVLLDIRLGDGSGLDLLKILSVAGLASRAIMISGEGTVTEAFQATQMGAFDYIEKPFTPERILVSAKRCFDFNDLQSKALKGLEILGNHTSVSDVNAMITRVAKTNGRVLIIGETGTGKELVARSVHRQSERSNQPLIKVNCAAIPHSLIESELFGHEKGAFTGAIKSRRGLFEQADLGTLFLDEVGELSLDVQAKLLRVLETGELIRLGSEKVSKVDVRVIAATHRDLQEMVQNSEFREDLFYRLNVVTINVPPLRERGNDITLLAKQFLQDTCEEHSVGHRSLSERALGQLAAYHWPGNIRELKNIIERVAILSESPVIDLIEDLQDRIDTTARQTAAVSEVETSSGLVCGMFQFESTVLPWQEFHKNLDQAYIKYVLRAAKGNVSEAARLLCLERAYLHRLMKKLGIQRDIIID
jgi:DNA-binding NtrC family response regulator